jgi:hypothetical protein
MELHKAQVLANFLMHKHELTSRVGVLSLIQLNAGLVVVTTGTKR